MIVLKKCAKSTKKESLIFQKINGVFFRKQCEEFYTDCETLHKSVMQFLMYSVSNWGQFIFTYIFCIKILLRERKSRTFAFLFNEVFFGSFSRKFLCSSLLEFWLGPNRKTRIWSKCSQVNIPSFITGCIGETTFMKEVCLFSDSCLFIANWL